MESELETKLANIVFKAKKIGTQKNDESRELVAKNTIDGLYGLFNNKEYSDTYPQIIIEKKDQLNLLYCNETIGSSRIRMYTMEANVVIEETAHFAIFYDYFISKDEKINFKDILNFYDTIQTQHVIIGSMIKIGLNEEYSEFKKIKMNDGQKEMIRELERQNYSLQDLVNLEKELVQSIE